MSRNKLTFVGTQLYNIFCFCSKWKNNFVMNDIPIVKKTGNCLGVHVNNPEFEGGRDEYHKFMRHSSDFSPNVPLYLSQYSNR